MPVLSDFKVDLDKEEALRFVRQRQGSPRPEAWLEAVDRAVEEALRLVRPAVAYDVFPVTAAEPSRLIVGEGHALESAVVASLFARAPEVVLMVYTIGPLLEERVGALGSAGDYPVAFALDIVGSVMLGKAGEVGYAVIEEMAKERGTRASIPLNPGTSHWPMSGQRLIARARRRERDWRRGARIRRAAPVQEHRLCRCPRRRRADARGRLILRLLR